MLGLAPETMLPEKYRRLWRRRLRRRPLLPFLLAATLAVDLAVRFANGWEEESFGSVFALGYFAGQLGLLGIWITHARRGLLPRIGLAIVTVSIALLLIDSLRLSEPESSESAPRYWAETMSASVQAIVLATLGTTVVAAGVTRLIVLYFDNRLISHRRGQFKISTLLWLTLILALLLGFGRYAAWDAVANSDVAMLIAAESLPVAIMLSASMWSRGMWKFLLLIGVPATLVLALTNAWCYSPTGDLQLSLYYCFQSLMLGTWLWMLSSTRFEKKAGPQQASPLSSNLASLDVTI